MNSSSPLVCIPAPPAAAGKNVSFQVAVYAAFMALLMLALATATYRLYARLQASRATMLVVIASWATSLSIAYLLPIDLYADAAAFISASSIWTFLYWFCFVTTWIIFPIQQNYETSGYFTFAGRMLDSLWQNILFYVIAGVLLVGLVIWVAVANQISSDKMQGILIVLSNFWGFSLYVMLLGYGLVEIPRLFWKLAGQKVNFRSLFYDMQKTSMQFEDAMDRVVEANRALQILSQRVEKEKPENANTLRAYISIIEKHVPKELFEYHRASKEETKFIQQMKEDKLTVHTFSKVHFRLKNDSIETRRHRSHFEATYEQIIKHMGENDIEDPEEAPLILQDGPRFRALRIMWKSLAVIACIFSILTLFSELTLPISKNISPFGLLIQAVRGNFGALQFFGLLFVFYLCLCSFYALFSLRLGKLYSLSPDRQSEEYSLLFNANFMIRLIFPLGLNFLDMIRVCDTDYQAALSSMQIVSLYGSFAQYFFPVLIGVFSVFTYFNVIGKLLKLLGVSSFDPQVSSSADVEIAEGKGLFKHEEERYLKRLEDLRDQVLSPLRVYSRSTSRVSDDPLVGLFCTAGTQLCELQCQLVEDLRHQQHAGVSVLGKYAAPAAACYARWALVADSAVRTILAAKLEQGIDIHDIVLYAKHKLDKLLTAAKLAQDHKTAADIQDAINTVHKAIQSQQDSQEILELEQQFKGQPALFAVGRALVHKGKLAKVCRSYDKTYMFHLFSDIITYSSDNATGLELHRKIDLLHCLIKDVQDSHKRKNAFQIISDSKSFVVFADTKAEKKTWMRLIEECIENLKAKKAKSLSTDQSKRDSQLAPVWVSDQDARTCELCSAHFTVFHRRHHCRICGKVVCNSCSTHRLKISSNSSGIQRVCDDCFSKVEEEKNGGVIQAPEPDSPNPHENDSKYLIMREIVETEQSYVYNLEIMHTIFIRPLIESSLVGLNRSQKFVVLETDMKDKIEIDVSFFTGRVAAFLSQIETLYTLNQEFLEDLEQRFDDWLNDTSFGDIFIQYAPLFKLYGEYAQGHSYFVDRLNEGILDKFIQKVQKDPRLKSQTIYSFLIMPIQRIPRYELLLKELKKKTDQKNPDTTFIPKAMEDLKKTAVFINDAIKMEENRSKIREIEEAFVDPVHLVDPSRAFIMSGELYKIDRTGKSMVRSFILFSDMLMYCKIQSRERLKLSLCMKLETLIVEDIPDSEKHKFCFKIKSSKKSFIVIAKSIQDKERWLTEINKAARKIIDQASQLGPIDQLNRYQAPVWKADKDFKQCFACNEFFSLFRRRHHCRECGNLFCSPCSVRRVVIHEISCKRPSRICDSCFLNLSTRMEIHDEIEETSFSDSKYSLKEDVKSESESVRPLDFPAHTMKVSQLIRVFEKAAEQPGNVSRENLSKSFRSDAKILSKTIDNVLCRRRMWSLTSGQALWMKDSDSRMCLACRKEFTVFNRRHHCRACGSLICGDCGEMRPLSNNGHTKDLSRVCDACWKIIAKI